MYDIYISSLAFFKVALHLPTKKAEMRQIVDELGSKLLHVCEVLVHQLGVLSGLEVLELSVRPKILPIGTSKIQPLGQACQAAEPKNLVCLAKLISIYIHQ